MTKSKNLYKNNDLLGKQTPELHSKKSNNYFLLKNHYEKTVKSWGKYNDELENGLNTKYLLSSMPNKCIHEKRKSYQKVGSMNMNTRGQRPNESQKAVIINMM